MLERIQIVKKSQVCTYVRIQKPPYPATPFTWPRLKGLDIAPYPQPTQVPKNAMRPHEVRLQKGPLG